MDTHWGGCGYLTSVCHGVVVFIQPLSPIDQSPHRHEYAPRIPATKPFTERAPQDARSLHPNGLSVDELLDANRRQLAAVPRLADAAERHTWVGLDQLVHVDTAGVYLAGE